MASVGRDWGSKTLAGALLGLSLALACSALFARLAGGIAPPIRAQLTMWMVMPIWLSVLGATYFFESGKRAWLWLALANVVAAGLLAAARMT
ncbi:MAG TPA: hypothetical protein VFX59_26325 [Polyangiales bacterium]|nr:hypothetical protein [Polyangiales bacterium]